VEVGLIKEHLAKVIAHISNVKWRSRATARREVAGGRDEGLREDGERGEAPCGGCEEAAPPRRARYPKSLLWGALR